MPLPYKKAIIYLDGVSSQVKTAEVINSIVTGLRLLNIQYKLYNNLKQGFSKLKEDMNQPDTLYILNDSASYHLCEQPNILITRTPFWVQATPKNNTIGIFTQERLTTNATEFVACIANNKPVRQPSDNKATHTYIITNDYSTDDLSTMARHGLAALSWDSLTVWDIHAEVLFHKFEGNSLPMVNKILKEGLEFLTHPDDIIIFINRDICLVKEATTIIRNYMDTYNVDSLYSRRRDIHMNSIIEQKDLSQYPIAEGADLFAFRANADCLKEILNTDLYIGRAMWDTFWMHKIAHELPCPVSYHPLHGPTWQKLSDGTNEHNIKQVCKKLPELKLLYNKDGALIAPLPV